MGRKSVSITIGVSNDDFIVGLKKYIDEKGQLVDNSRYHAESSFFVPSDIDEAELEQLIKDTCNDDARFKSCTELQAVGILHDELDIPTDVYIVDNMYTTKEQIEEDKINNCDRRRIRKYDLKNLYRARGYDYSAIAKGQQEYSIVAINEGNEESRKILKAMTYVSVIFFGALGGSSFDSAEGIIGRILQSIAGAMGVTGIVLLRILTEKIKKIIEHRNRIREEGLGYKEDNQAAFKETMGGIFKERKK